MGQNTRDMRHVVKGAHACVLGAIDHSLCDPVTAQIMPLTQAPQSNNLIIDNQQYGDHYV